MTNRTGTYFGFDGLGETDPTKSDFKYYSTVQAWAVGKHIEFKAFIHPPKCTSTPPPDSKCKILLELDENEDPSLAEMTRKTVEHYRVPNTILVAHRTHRVLRITPTA